MKKERDIMKERWKDTEIVKCNTHMICSNKIYGEIEKERSRYYERETERQREIDRERERGVEERER